MKNKTLKFLISILIIFLSFNAKAQIDPSYKRERQWDTLFNPSNLNLLCSDDPWMYLNDSIMPMGVLKNCIAFKFYDTSCFKDYSDFDNFITQIYRKADKILILSDNYFCREMSLASYYNNLTFDNSIPWNDPENIEQIILFWKYDDFDSFRKEVIKKVREKAGSEKFNSKVVVGDFKGLYNNIYIYNSSLTIKIKKRSKEHFLEFLLSNDIIYSDIYENETFSEIEISLLFEDYSLKEIINIKNKISKLRYCKKVVLNRHQINYPLDEPPKFSDFFNEDTSFNFLENILYSYSTKYYTGYNPIFENIYCMSGNIGISSKNYPDTNYLNDCISVKFDFFKDEDSIISFAKKTQTDFYFIKLASPYNLTNIFYDYNRIGHVLFENYYRHTWDTCDEMKKLTEEDYFYVKPKLVKKIIKQDIKKFEKEKKPEYILLYKKDSIEQFKEKVYNEVTENSSNKDLENIVGDVVYKDYKFSIIPYKYTICISNFQSENKENLEETLSEICDLDYIPSFYEDLDSCKIEFDTFSIDKIVEIQKDLQNQHFGNISIFNMKID